jgi:hypothetical protein
MLKLSIIITAALALSGCAAWDALTNKGADLAARAIVDTDYCNLAPAERDKIRNKVNTEIAARWAKKGKTGPAPTLMLNC